ncbi:MAG: hypothetical protein ACJ8J0_07205 [Longimicrobiaceae bacterium]
MTVLILALIALALLFAVRMNRRRSSETWQGMLALAEQRVRLWYALLQLAEGRAGDPDAARAQAAVLARAVHERLEQLRADHAHDPEAALLVAGVYASEAAATGAMVEHAPPAPQDVSTAREWLARAEADARIARSRTGGVFDWKATVRGALLSAVWGALVGWQAARIYSGALAPPWFPWWKWMAGFAFASVLLAWVVLDLTPQLGRRLYFAAFITVVALWSVGYVSPRTTFGYDRLSGHPLDLPSLSDGCPHPLPRIARSEGRPLSEARLCGLVFLARRALPERPETHAFRARGDTAGVEIALVSDRSATDPRRRERYWRVHFVFTHAPAREYRVWVSRLDGDAILARGP